jgi:3-deoxy-manno-octulosonate cytidylyltransferase (CMP-KDO synthetase)
MKTCLAIPARLNSSRLPNKLLQPIDGRPVLEHTLEKAKDTSLFDEIILVTDHPRLAEIGKRLSVRVEIEKSVCHNGTERIHKILHKIDADIIVNLQADEMELPAQYIEQVLQESVQGTEIVSAMYPIHKREIAECPDVVKVVCNQYNEALYFSRSLIPFHRQPIQHNFPLAFGHCGIYSFQRDVLQRLATEPICELEQRESLEQLRALFVGYSIKMIQIPFFQSINTYDDLYKLRNKYED